MTNKLNISPDLTIEDLHKIREYHYELTKDMTFEKRKAFYEEGIKEMVEDYPNLKKAFEKRKKPILSN